MIEKQKESSKAIESFWRDVEKSMGCDPGALYPAPPGVDEEMIAKYPVKYSHCNLRNI